MSDGPLAHDSYLHEAMRAEIPDDPPDRAEYQADHPDERRVREIRERVAAATQGPWGIDGMDDEEWGVRPYADIFGICRMLGRRSDPRAAADGELIAHAPDDLGWLCDQLEQAWAAQ